MLRCAWYALKPPDSGANTHGCHHAAGLQAEYRATARLHGRTAYSDRLSVLMN